MQKWWKVVHVTLIGLFLIQIFYGLIQVFFNCGPLGPLFGRSISEEMFLRRRLYAIETWISIAGFAIYLAIIYKE